jgi:hypothetical protein
MEAEEIVTRVLHWSDYAAMAIVIALGLVLIIGVLIWASKKDKEVQLYNKANVCGLHDWKWNADAKQFQCKNCKWVAKTNGGSPESGNF